MRMAQTTWNVAEKACTWRADKLAPEKTAVILKHVQYKGPRDCVHVRKAARVRLDDGRRVYATQVYWEYVFGVKARRIDAHMRRSCSPRAGFVCMNPAHISYAETGEAASALIARLWAQRAEGRGEKPSTPSKPSNSKKGTVTEETLWQNRADATEEMVMGVEDIPAAIDAPAGDWRVLDYFRLMPVVEFEQRAVGRPAVTS